MNSKNTGGVGFLVALGKMDIDKTLKDKKE
jgi:hypothetical protein